MAGRTSKKSVKVAKKAAARRVASKAAKPRQAVARASARKPAKAVAKELPAHSAVPNATVTKSKGPAVAAKPTLLAGGNPQIAKAEGDAPVQVYIAAMPGWKSDVGRRLDALIVKKATTAMQPRKSGSKEGEGGHSPSQLIDARIKELSDWRGETLARIRTLIQQADPEVIEEWKWRGVPVWSHAGILCTGETYQSVVKMTFAQGASLPDPAGLFNSSLEGNTRRAIDFHESDKIDEQALQALIRAAVALNTSARATPGPARSPKKPKSA